MDYALVRLLFILIEYRGFRDDIPFDLHFYARKTPRNYRYHARDVYFFFFNAYYNKQY